MELELRITGSTTPRQLQAAATLLLTLAGMEVETPKATTATTAKANKTADTPVKNDIPATEGKALTLQDITERAQAYNGKDAIRKAKMRDLLDKYGAVSLSKLKEAHYLSFITELETD